VSGQARYAPGDVSVVIVRREHQTEGIENVSSCLLARAALAERTRDLHYARDDPTVFVRLVVRDRQP
jgi:hypothetical protein